MKPAEVLAAVESGEANVPLLVPIAPGVEVWGDVLKVGNVRVGVRARVAQQIADLLGLSLTSAVLEDMVYQSAHIVLPPFTFNPSTLPIDPTTGRRYTISDDEIMRQHSAKIDAALKKAGHDGPSFRAGTIIASLGKSWVLDNVLERKPGRAANYGWHGGGARYAPASRSAKVWQPVSTAHNIEHYDYSQTLRLCRLDPGAALPFKGEPIRVDRIPNVDLYRGAEPASPPFPAHADTEPPPATERVPDVEVDPGTIGERAVAVAFAEMDAQNPPTAKTVAKYHSVAVRNGRRLGIKKGNHCASAASWCGREALREDEVLPHQLRAGAKELMRDAVARGTWRPIASVLDGSWTPSVGDLAIYDRSKPGKPSTAWYGHVDRVSKVGETDYENIGANEGFKGAWKVARTKYSYRRLLGFVDYSVREGEMLLGVGAIDAGIDDLADLPDDSAG